MSSIEFVEKLIARSRAFLRDALSAYFRGDYDNAVFYLEQALQLYAKACCIAIRGFVPHIHEIRQVVGLIYEVSRDSELSDLLKKYRKELTMLEEAYISSRYVLKSYTSQDFVTLLRTVIDLIRTLSRVCRTPLPMDKELENLVSKVMSFGVQ